MSFLTQLVVGSPKNHIGPGGSNFSPPLLLLPPSLLSSSPPFPASPTTWPAPLPLPLLPLLLLLLLYRNPYPLSPTDI